MAIGGIEFPDVDTARSSSVLLVPVPPATGNEAFTTFVDAVISHGFNSLVILSTDSIRARATAGALLKGLELKGFNGTTLLKPPMSSTPQEFVCDCFINRPKAISTQIAVVSELEYLKQLYNLLLSNDASLKDQSRVMRIFPRDFVEYFEVIHEIRLVDTGEEVYVECPSFYSRTSRHYRSNIVLIPAGTQFLDEKKLTEDSIAFLDKLFQQHWAKEIRIFDTSGPQLVLVDASVEGRLTAAHVLNHDHVYFLPKFADLSKPLIEFEPSIVRASRRGCQIIIIAPLDILKYLATYCIFGHRPGTLSIPNSNSVLFIDRCTPEFILEAENINVKSRIVGRCHVE